MTRTAWLLAGSAAMVAVPAAARDGAFYVGVDGGIMLEDQLDVDIDAGRPDGLQENAAFADTNTGLDADIVFGYDFGAFRLEAEGGYKRAGYDSLTVESPDLVPGADIAPGTVVQNEKDLSIFSGMVNGILEYGKTFQIFAGGGAGFANVDLPVEVAGVGTVIDDSTTDFAWQLLGGFRFAVTDNIDLGVKYRYFVID
ncbi:MAG: outer membrane protein, partial [Erythrobacter sp.]